MSRLYVHPDGDPDTLKHHHFYTFKHDHENSHPDFYPDFHLLGRCEVVLAPSSTFSFAAAMLGECREFWRSSLRTQGFQREDPWDAYPLQHDRVADFVHVPGISGVDPRYA